MFHILAAPPPTHLALHLKQPRQRALECELQLRDTRGGVNQRPARVRVSSQLLRSSPIVTHTMSIGQGSF